MMKNLFFILFLSFIMPLTTVAQNDTAVAEKLVFENRQYLDLSLLGLGYNYQKPITDKLAFDFGVQAGFIYNYFIFHIGKRKSPVDYAEAISAMFGVSGNNIRRLSCRGGVKLTLPYIFEGSNYKSPLIGSYVMVSYNVSAIVSIGTNIDVLGVKYGDKTIFGITTSFVHLRIRISK